MLKRNLIVIGNGFALHHHIKTQYIDYREFLIQSGNKDVVNCFGQSLDDDKN